jgi:molybdopterin converting factor small subunit
MFPLSTIRITVRFFAHLREKAGTAAVTQAVEANLSLADFLSRLAATYPLLAPSIAEGRLLIVVNQSPAGTEYRLCDGDEIALLPPFSGGQ